MRSDDQDDVFGGSDSEEEKYRITKCLNQDYEDEETDSELESKLQNDSLQKRLIETRDNRRARR